MFDKTDFFESVTQGYTFDDVYLVPAYSEIESRSEKCIDLSSSVSPLVPASKMKVPIIAANMDKICDVEMILAMLEVGASGVLHRFMPEDEMLEKIKYIFENGSNNSCFGFSVGLKTTDSFLKRVNELINEYYKKDNYLAKGVYVVLDVAHGDHSLVLNKIEEIKKYLSIPIVAGNICTPEAAFHLIEAGANILKIGIGPGAVCSTRVVAGCGYPQLSAIKSIREYIRYRYPHVKLIADGGIKWSGDIVKALAAGADFVMVGSLFAGTTETPGKVLTVGHAAERKVKVYSGMASYDSQINHFGKEKKEITPEGVSSFVRYKGTVKDVVRNVVGGINSGFSYCGCKDLQELHEYGDMTTSWIKITNSTIAEGSPHILNKEGLL